MFKKWFMLYSHIGNQVLIEVWPGGADPGWRGGVAGGGGATISLLMEWSVGGELEESGVTSPPRRAGRAGV